ncbi:hypothetical protein INT48_000431 [Thamnidium elegans]|uniref:Glutaredoxin domain-containing protein n=1 Tax=Thamnidium elegans TaxID=101142 RepID=A0A8H7SNX3_9FUNG|nr:hypothetical protein INT48_000431 [Thamnidium elegans]
MSSLPFTVQDDIEAKEKYASTQQKGLGSRNCNSRRLRLWFLIIIASLTTLGLVTYFGKSGFATSIQLEDEVVTIATAQAEPVDTAVKESQNKPLDLKDEITQLINDNELIVFSKTYSKRILSSYEFITPVKVVEVDLRDDDYKVKMVLKEISARETFPNIFLHGKTLGGSDDLEELHETGTLKQLFNNLLLH